MVGRKSPRPDTPDNFFHTSLPEILHKYFSTERDSRYLSVPFVYSRYPYRFGKPFLLLGPIRERRWKWTLKLGSFYGYVWVFLLNLNRSRDHVKGDVLFTIRVLDRSVPTRSVKTQVPGLSPLSKFFGRSKPQFGLFLDIGISKYTNEGKYPNRKKEKKRKKNEEGKRGWGEIFRKTIISDLY